MMGETECLIKYVKCEQGWECVISWRVSADGMKQSLF